jgi:hypothetical protein
MTQGKVQHGIFHFFGYLLRSGMRKEEIAIAGSGTGSTGVEDS